MGNYVPKAEHASSYWQEVARTMDLVNAASNPDAPVNPQGHTKDEINKPGGLNKPPKANP